MSTPGMFTFMPDCSWTMRVARGPRNSLKKHVTPGRASHPNGAVPGAAWAAGGAPLASSAAAATAVTYARLIGCSLASARGDRGLRKPRRDQVPPRLPAARVGAGNPVAAAEPSTIEIVAGPIDADALAVAELVHVRAPVARR